MSDSPMAQEVCDHFWAWVSPAGAKNAARLCMKCHEPSAEWLNKMWDQLSEKDEIMCGCHTEHRGYSCGSAGCHCHAARTSLRDSLFDRRDTEDFVYVSISFPKMARRDIHRTVAAATHAAGVSTSYNVFIEDSPVEDED